MARIARNKGSQLLLAMASGLLLSASQLAWADDVPADKLSEEEKKKALELDKAKMFLDKEKALLTSQTELAKAKVAAVTPAAGEGVTALSGSVTGADKLTFAMYMVSLEGLERVAQAVCNDLATQGVTNVFMTGKDVVEAAAKYETAQRSWQQLEDRLREVATEATQNTQRLTKWPSKAAQATPESTQPQATPEAAGIASAIDIAAGLIKGTAGLAALFKSERTITGADNVIGAAEIAAAFSMCREDAGNRKAPVILYVDNDITALKPRIGTVSAAVNRIGDVAGELDRALARMSDAATALDAEIEKATADAAKDKKNKPYLDGLAKSKVPGLEAFKTRAAALVTASRTYVDSMYQADATTGLSPLIVTAQFGILSDAMQAKNRLALTLLKSGGYSLTTKRLLLNDRVDYAGGVAVRVSVTRANGDLAYDRVFYRDSGWIRADFDKTGEAIKRQNF